MKLSNIFIFAFLGQVSAGSRRLSLSFSGDDNLNDCLDCMEDLDDARDCLRDCASDSVETTSGSTESLLTMCLDESEEGFGSSVNSLDDLVDCCDFDSDCERDLEDAQDCLEFCLDSCISDQAEEYLDCIRDESAGGSSSCDLDDCIDGFLSDDLGDELDSSLESSNDLFSLEALSRRITKIDENQLEDCNLLADFVDSSCEVATDCCSRCEEEFGEFIDCLVNDIVIPFVSIELNKTIPTCPIDTEDCELESVDSGRKERRQRRAERAPPTPEEEALIQRALALPSESQKQNKRNVKREEIIADFRKSMVGGRRLETYNNTAAIAACEATMRKNIVAHNMTHAMNLYTECVSVAAIETLAANSPQPESSASGPFVAFSALVAAVVAAVAFF